MSVELLVSSCDTGSANALAPVLSGLSCEYLVVAQKDAARVFDRWKIPYRRVDPIDWDRLLAAGTEALSSVQARAIVTGTSWGPSIDKALALAARERGIPCAAIIEHWDLYMERFSAVEAGRIRDRGRFIPDRVWVNDEIALREACSAGLPAVRVEVVGQPHLERQLRLLRGKRGSAARGGVIFVSERVRDDFPEGTPLYRGFDEFKALDQLINSIDFSATELTIKLHPQESEGKFDALVRGRGDIKIVKEADNLQLIADAERLVGMFSMLLLEAALVRNDVISFLPGGDPSIFVGNRVGATAAAITKEELQWLLGERAARAGRVDEDITEFGARFVGSAARMTDAIERLMQ